MKWFNFRWWLSHTKPVMMLKTIKFWFYHRFHPSHRYNLIDTKLKPGYYDKDYLMLHGCFALLRDFVEGELAWMKLICSDERDKVPWWMSFERYRNKNARRLGLEHLTYWEHYDNSDLDLEQQEIDRHAADDKEVRELYFWWVDARPNRPDPFDAYDDDNSDDFDSVGAMKIDGAYHQEDEDMLIRLMKVRCHLWT